MTSLSREVIDLLSLFAKVDVGDDSTALVSQDTLGFTALPPLDHPEDMQLDCTMLGGSFSSRVNRDLRVMWRDDLFFASELKPAYEALVSGNLLLSLLLSTSLLETVIREAVNKQSTLLTVPHKLCDLLLILETCVDDSHLIRALSALSGPIHGVNARNLAWHGFLTNDETPQTLCSMIIVCCFTVVHRMGITALPRDVQVGALPCDGLPAPSPASIEMSTFPVRNRDQWWLAFALYERGEVLSGLSLLFALNENSIRVLYGTSNRNEAVLVTASTSELCATLDEFLETHEDNRLFEEIPHDLGLALLDGFYWKEAACGRLRDHIAHGSRSASAQQALFFFSLATALLEHFCDGRPRQPHAYVSLFHPISRTIPLFGRASAEVAALAGAPTSMFDAVKQRVARLCCPGFVCDPVISSAEKKQAFALLTSVQYVLDICEGLRRCRAHLEQRRDTHRNSQAQSRAQEKIDRLDESEREIRAVLEVALRLVHHMGAGRRLGGTFEVDLSNHLGCVANACRQNKVSRALALLLCFTAAAGDARLVRFTDSGVLSLKEASACGILPRALLMPDVLLAEVCGEPTALWTAGVILERHYAALPDFEMSDRSVLELGAGAGHLSVCLAHRGARVVATEMPGKEVRILRRTAARVQHLLPKGRLCAEELMWGEQGWAQCSLASRRVPFDFVVGADLTYDDEELWPLLIYTMDKVVSEHTVMYLGFTNRDDFGMGFLSDLHDCALFDIDSLPMDNADLLSEDTEVYLFVITRRK